MEKLAHSHHETVADFVRFATAPDAVSDANSEMSLRCTTANNWNGGVCMGKTADQIANPPADMMEQANRMIEEIESFTASIVRPTAKRKMIRGLDDGSELNVDRFLSADVNMFDDMRTAYRAVANKRIRLAVNVGANCGRGQAELLHRGCAIVALANFLTSTGAAVEVTAIRSGIHRTSMLDIADCVTVVVKQAHMPLDVSAMIVPCASMAFARNLMLRAEGRTVLEHLRQTGHKRDMKINGSLGRPMNEPNCIRSKFDMVVPMNVLNYESAINWLREVCETYAEKQTVPPNVYEKFDREQIPDMPVVEVETGAKVFA